MNELARRPLPHMTEDEFLVWEGDGSGRKFHLIDGEVVAMAPASRIHGLIQGNLIVLITAAIEASGASMQVVSEGAIIPGLSRQDNVRVPDVVVAADDDAKGDIAVPDPVVLIEILSPGNASVTRDNARAYATLPSVQEIALLSSTRIEAELYVRTDAGHWPPAPAVVKPGGRFVLSSVGLDCPIERVYARTWLGRPVSPT